MNRRAFLGAVAAALAAARAPRLGDGSKCLDGPGPFWGRGQMPQYFCVGDIVTFGRDSREYVVVEVMAASVIFRPHTPKLNLWRA